MTLPSELIAPCPRCGACYEPEEHGCDCGACGILEGHGYEWCASREECPGGRRYRIDIEAGFWRGGAIPIEVLYTPSSYEAELEEFAESVAAALVEVTDE